jgi:hypothetical protein
MTMTRSRNLKQAIRTRAAKTGERYTTARRHVLHALKQVKKEDTAPKPAPVRRTTSIGGVTDANAHQRTGHGLDHWFAVLDRFSADNKGHTAAAQHLYEAHGVPGWHAQGITVAWERARGLRRVNQSCAGDYQVSVSKVVGASVAEVIEAIRNQRRRADWLRDADAKLVEALTAALAGTNGKGITVKSADAARLRYRWNDSVVELRIDSRPGGKASIAADNTKLKDHAAVKPRRAAWRKALDGLARSFFAG